MIRGSMGLAEIERQTGVPAAYIIEKLKMPVDVSRDTNMGRLKREYGFDMPQVREIIREYLKSKPAFERR